MYAAYGGMTLPADYDTYVGLVLNIPRVRFQWAAMALAGAAAASHNEPLDEIWADALASTPEEVPELLDQINRDRITKKLLAQTGRRGL